MSTHPTVHNWVWFKLSWLHSCHWPNAFMSLTTECDLNSVDCIRVIDHWVWFKLSRMHSCHWPNAFVSLTTECDLNSVECIRVIDQMHSCHWPMSVIQTQQSAYLSLTRSLRGTHKTCVDTPYCAYLSLTTECDINSVDCIRVIDQMHSCHWPLSVI